jgi:hypothetical protein
MKNSRRFDFYRKQTDPQVWMSLAKLMDRFYGLDAVSTRVTSSHWEKFGRSQKAEFIDDSCLSIHGLGFGDYENNKTLELDIALKIFLQQLPQN